jgi:predicted permease
VLGFTGGAIGCVLAYGLLSLFRTLAPDATVRISESTVDLRVLVFTLALSLIATLVFGLAPAIERYRGERLAAPHVAGPRNQRLRSALVSLQFAISVVLLTGSGLFVMSLWRLQQTHLGFTPENVVSASFILPEQRYGSEVRQVAFFNDLERRLSDIPGVIAAAITDSLPPGGDPRSIPFVALIGGGNADADGLQGLVKWRYVTPGYFKTLGIPIRRGRAFTDHDRVSGAPPVVISETLARRIVGTADPIGKQLRAGEQIVGVAADVRNSGLHTAPDPELYVLRTNSPNATSRNQRPPFGWRLAIAAIRSTNSAQASTAALQKAIQETEPTVAIVTTTLVEQVKQYSAQPRFQTVLLSLFAFVGVMLAAIGLYGLTSFIVATRTREVGVRIALGATRADIVALMMKGVCAWTLAGVLGGFLASLGVMQSLRTLLFEVEPLDARAIGAAIVLLVIASLTGTWIPSARAARIEPMKALRQE